MVAALQSLIAHPHFREAIDLEKKAPADLSPVTLSRAPASKQ
jgi:hypothetical protein